MQYESRGVEKKRAWNAHKYVLEDRTNRSFEANLLRCFPTKDTRGNPSSSREEIRGKIFLSIYITHRCTYASMWARITSSNITLAIWKEKEREMNGDKKRLGKVKGRSSRGKMAKGETKPARKSVQFLKPVQSASYAKSITFYPYHLSPRWPSLPQQRVVLRFSDLQTPDYLTFGVGKC